ncbi:MAG: flagellar hook-basal body complex protein FliE [Candidatus Zixiibacteriota bacterium]|nr:MAG: flagellar hook-basal body complex protein FliE [candidate division Zixibacteria bacterium]
MDEIRRIQSILQQQAPPEAKPSGPVAGETSFKDTLNSFMEEVNSLQQNADESTQKLLSGELESVHQVMMAMEEANTSFQLMMEMRNKILEAYREVMRMQV